MIEGHRWVFHMNVANLLDTRYWSNAVNGNLGVGVPRTIKFSAKVEF
jgi:outer membrane receptor protein involved in Fe transport